MDSEINSLLTKEDEKKTEETIGDIVKEKKEKKEKKDKQKEKKKKKRCFHCNTKLNMIHYTCKCGQIFCHKHLNAHSHNCTYDYSSEKKKYIQENNPKIYSKMVEI